jgi:hypothetical protein
MPSAGTGYVPSLHTPPTSNCLPPREAMGDQEGDGRSAGVVGAEDLSQEDPQRDQREKGAV